MSSASDQVTFSGGRRCFDKQRSHLGVFVLESEDLFVSSKQSLARDHNILSILKSQAKREVIDDSAGKGIIDVIGFICACLIFDGHVSSGYTCPREICLT